MSRAASGKRARVVLYNPKAVFHTFPLALLAVGSALDRTRYEVLIVDGRLEADAVGAALRAADGAVVFGVTALTGAPLRDALDVSRAVKERYPDLPVVWGGWHPSLFPTETLKEPCIDVAVQGQGEATFKELVDCLASGGDLAQVAGISYRADGVPTRNAPRKLVNMDELPAQDYDLIDVEAYFAHKGRRQLDYISSTGCPFRCAFCADPFVFGRKWTAIGPERMGEELEALWTRYRFDELAFQDETFFTYRDRVEGIADQLLQRGIRCTWTATLRADQSERLSDEIFEKCVRSGFNRAMIGVESGSQEMMDWMQKDIKIEQVLAAAERCARFGIGAIFPFIVGFPGESDASVQETVRIMKILRAMSPRFETPLFFFKPYPGSRITQDVVAEGYTLPDTVEGWADFDFIGSAGPWVSDEKRRFFERFKFYNHFAWGPRSPLRLPLQVLSRWRCRRDAYALPWEKLLVERLWPQPELS